MKIKTNIFYILFSLTHHTVVLTKDGAIPAPALGEQTIREQIKIEKKKYKNQLHLLYVCNLLAKQKKEINYIHSMLSISVDTLTISPPTPTVNVTPTTIKLNSLIESSPGMLHANGGML